MRLTKPLSRRQAEVLDLLAGGLTDREIAAELGIGVATVAEYLSDIKAKLGLARARRTILAAWAVTHRKTVQTALTS